MSAADALRHIGPLRGPILWQPPPEPITWTLPKPMVHAGMRYDSVKLGAPTSEDVLKATAVRGAAPLEVTLRIIESASAVPYDVLKQQPHWFNQQIADYLRRSWARQPPTFGDLARRETRRGAGRSRAGSGRGRGSVQGHRRAGSGSSAATLIALALSGELEILAARAGRFYGDGLRWALALPLPALLRWVRLISRASERKVRGSGGRSHRAMPPDKRAVSSASGCAVHASSNSHAQRGTSWMPRPDLGRPHPVTVSS